MAKKPEAGRGKKTCPACNKVVGSRAAKCECGHEFAIKAKASKGGKKANLDPMTVIGKVKEFGGVGAVQKALNQVAAAQAKVDEAAAQLAALGGEEGAEAALQLMATLEAALKGK